MPLGRDHRQVRRPEDGPALDNDRPDGEVLAGPPDIRTCREGLRHDDLIAPRFDQLEWNYDVGVFGTNGTSHDSHRCPGRDRRYFPVPGNARSDDAKVDRPFQRRSADIGMLDRVAIHRRRVEPGRRRPGDDIPRQHQLPRVPQRHSSLRQHRTAEQDPPHRFLDRQVFALMLHALHAVTVSQVS